MIINPFVFGGTTGTWNPSDKDADVALSGGNLVATFPAPGNTGSVRAHTVYSSGDRYFEIVLSGANTEFVIGVGNNSANLANPPGGNVNSWGYYAPLGRGYHNGGFTFTGASYTTGDVIGVRFDGTTLTFYKAGVSQGTATPTTSALYPMAGNAAGATPQVVCTLNTGGSAFSNLPSGASAWG